MTKCGVVSKHNSRKIAIFLIGRFNDREARTSCSRQRELRHGCRISCVPVTHPKPYTHLLEKYNLQPLHKYADIQAARRGVVSGHNGRRFAIFLIGRFTYREARTRCSRQRELRHGCRISRVPVTRPNPCPAY